jgi:hypothetical protein
MSHRSVVRDRPAHEKHRSINVIGAFGAKLRDAIVKQNAIRTRTGYIATRM